MISYVILKYAPYDWLKYRGMAILVCRKIKSPAGHRCFLGRLIYRPQSYGHRPSTGECLTESRTGLGQSPADISDIVRSPDGHRKMTDQRPFSVPGCIKGAQPAFGVFPVLEVRQSCTHRSRPDTYRAPAVFLSGHAGNPDLSRPDPVRLCDIGRLSHENRTGTWRGSHDIWRWPADVPPAPHHKFSTFIDPLSSDYLPNIARGPVEPRKELDHCNDDRQIFTGPPTS